MTTKHFQALADALRDSRANPETVRAVAAVCAANNPRFNRQRFIAAATREDS